MTRSRLVVVASFTVVSLGVAAALGALLLDPARAAVGPLPAEGLALPAGTRFVMGVDLPRFVASPLYQKLAAKETAHRMEALREFEERTGVNPERDVEQVLVAGSKTDKGNDEVVALFLGRFDRYKLGRAIETEKKDVTWKDHHGTNVYLFSESELQGKGGSPRKGRHGSGAMAFLDDRSIVIGAQAAVEAVVANRAEGTASLKSNAALTGLLEQVKPGSTFWMVGDRTLLAHLPSSIPSPGGAAGSSIDLPSLKSLVVSGDLDPQVSLHLTGEAADEAAATQLADVVRGLTALMALQAGQRPQLKELASAIGVTTEATRVHVEARIPYALIDSLVPAPPVVAEEGEAKAAPDPKQ